MAQTLQANKVSLLELREQFGLMVAQDLQFFSEWQSSAPDITAAEIQTLDRIKANFENLMATPPVLEGAVKMVIVSGLLDLAGFYRQPFNIYAEKQIEVSSPGEEEGVIIRGMIDVLVVRGLLLILVIESKMSSFALNVALPQALSYMMAGSQPVTFGLITNGIDFIFLKLAKEGTPQYSTSRVFSLLTAGNELVEVLQILKALGGAIAP
jgi:predicted type IV restriction endonuclease